MRLPLHKRDGSFVAWTEVDAEDHSWASEFTWHLAHGYAKRMPGCKNVYLHREIAERHGLDLSPSIDHVDRNKLNNRAENLRTASNQLQSFNRQPSKRNTSGVVGVHWSKAKDKWRAGIRVNGFQHHLGFFSSKDEAATARKNAELEVGL